MLNDALSSSYSPAGQKSFNKRLKDLENQIKGYDSAITTGKVTAEEIEAQKGKITDLEVDTLKVNVSADIKEETVEKSTIGELNATKINSTDIENANSIKTKTLEAEESVKAETVEATNGNIDNIESKTIHTEDLEVDNIISKLNLHKLDIDGKEALSSLAEQVLEFGNGYVDASIKSGNRPKWGELKIATEEQVNGPFTIKGKVDSINDLPLSFDDKNVECEIKIPATAYRETITNAFGGNLNWSEEEPHGNVATFAPTAYEMQKRFVDEMVVEVNTWLHEKGYDQYIADITEQDFYYQGDVAINKNTSPVLFTSFERFENYGTAVSITYSAGQYYWAVSSGAYADEKEWSEDTNIRATHVIPTVSKRMDDWFTSLPDNELINMFARLHFELNALGKANRLEGTNSVVTTLDDPTNKWLTKPLTSQYWRGFTEVPGTVVEDQVNKAGDVYIVAGDNPGVAIWVQVDALDSDSVETLALIKRTATFTVSSNSTSAAFGIQYTVGDEGTGSPLSSLITEENKDDTAYTTCKVYRGGVWTFIPYMILANYRTAADQNAIDANLQEQIDNINVRQDDQDERIQTVQDNLDAHVDDFEAYKDEVGEKFDATDEIINELSTEVADKVSEAPKNGRLYGRKDGSWAEVSADGLYVPKNYNKIEKYFSDIVLKKDPSYVNTSQLYEVEVEGETVQYFLGLWHLDPAESGDYPYTTKNMYDFVEANKDNLNADVVAGVEEAFNAGRVIGWNWEHTSYQTLEWTDTFVAFDAEKAGDNIERPDGATIGNNKITSNDDGVNISSDIGFTATTPSPVSGIKSVINRDYVHQNISLSNTSSSSETSAAVLRVKKQEIDSVLDRADCYAPRCQNNIIYPDNSNWMHRTKDYIYYKVDNQANQPANTFSFWFSIDKDENIINMTTPREDKENAVAVVSDFESWMTFNPSSWDGVNDNIAYWPHVDPTYGGYITMFDNGRFAGYVEDATGQSNSIYAMSASTGFGYTRAVGGKSLRGDIHRILMVNNITADADAIKAGIIGVDADNNEGYNKFKPIVLPTRIKWGHRGVAAGKKHWFAQQNTSNTFMVISPSGTVASYVLSDPTTQIALGTTVQNCGMNFIELENGDVIFAVKDYSTDIMYHIYCHDNFEEEGIDPFTVYRSAIDFSSAAADGWPCVWGYPYVEFGDYVYFFPTKGCEFDTGFAYLSDVTKTAQYSRFNKSTKTWSDATLPWINSNVYACTVPFKTHDPVEDKDYLWLFQANGPASTTSPTQAQCVVISENGALQYVDLGTGSAIHWFDSTVADGQVFLNYATWNRPLNISGTASDAYGQTVRPIVPYASVTKQGIGIMLSNGARDVCIFYGNCHFAVYSYDNFTDGGPWSVFATDGTRGASFVGGEYGCLLYARYNNSLVLQGDETDSPFSIIYIKPTGDDFLGEPEYTVKPIDTGSWVRGFFRYLDGADYAKTDFSDYSGKGLLTKITPMVGMWEPSRGMTDYEIEDVQKSNTLYLKDGDYIISSVNL